MGRITDEVGNKYANLLIIKYLGKNKYNQALWECLCDCGQISAALGHSLRSGNTKSCGCLRSAKSRDRASRHGLRAHPLYGTWANIKTRCTLETGQDYRFYGGRGIRMFSDWLDDPALFIHWVNENLGSKPEGTSLDRIDNDGNYEPGNLRWADKSTQIKNRRKFPIGVPLAERKDL